MDTKAIKKKTLADKNRKSYSAGILQKRQKRLISADGSTNLLPKLNFNLNKDEILSALKNMTGHPCPSNADKFYLLRRRDELLSKLRELNSVPGTHKVIQGTCPDMCPEKERYMRDVKKNVHFYECDSRGQMAHDKMVKDYSRSAADQDMPLAHELRPLDALQTTMDYLIFNIANEMPDTNTELARWYDFLWSRTRAIRKDITQQMLHNESAVDLVEKCVRLHIFASFKLRFLESDLFDHRINTENLSKSMQTLRHMYEDLAKKQKYCPNEPEFRSYDIILNLSDFNIHSQVLSYRPFVRESQQVQLALNLASALQNTNYVRFFRLVRNQATFLQACLCYQFFTLFRTSALKVICMAYHIFPLENFIENLAFDTFEQALLFIKVFKVELDVTDPNQINARDGRIILNSGETHGPVPHTNCEWIEEKANNLKLSQILCNDPLATRSLKHDFNHKLVNSFSTDTQAYLNDPVVNSLLAKHEINITNASQNELPVSGQQQLSILSNFSFTSVFQNIKKSHPISDNFVLTQTDLIIDQIVTLQLSFIANCCYNNMIKFKLQEIHKNLQRERLRRYIRHWIFFTQKQKLLRMVKFSRTKIADTLLQQIILTQLNMISAKLCREARRISQRELMAEFATLKSTDIYEETISTQLYSIACRVRANQVKSIQQKLERIRQNLHRKWLKQFTNHWLTVTRRNRILRSITLLPATADLSISTLSSKHFFIPNAKKRTLEKMREMAEQRLEQSNKQEKPPEELMTNAQNGIVEETEASLAISIRDTILNGTSFTQQSTSNGFAESASTLRLYKPCAKRFKPECMHKMADEKLQQLFLHK